MRYIIYVNSHSPMSIPVSITPFLGQFDVWLNFEGPGWERAGPPNVDFGLLQFRLIFESDLKKIMQNHDFSTNLVVILWKFEGATRPKHKSRWPIPNILHGLLIYIYFKGGIKKLPKNSPEGVVFNGKPPQGLTLKNIARVSRVKQICLAISSFMYYARKPLCWLKRRLLGTQKKHI